MKLRVAYVLRVSLSTLISTALLLSIASAQTQKRSTTKRPAKPTQAAQTPESMTICQGVQIPRGYVIVAYITTTACPHGAYVLRKQDQYSETVADTYKRKQQNTGTSAPTTNTGSTSLSSPSNSTGSSSTLRNSVRTSSPSGNISTSARIIRTPDPNSQYSTPNTLDQTPSDEIVDPFAPNTNVVPAATISRPRRVASSAPSDTVAVVTDDEPERPARPPQWAGTAPSNSPAPKTTEPVGDLGPEEVDEGDVVRVDTNFVTVPVTVVDRQGRFIPDLKREDFKVFENGVEQTVAHWEPADKPFTVALLLDTSPSTQFHLWQIKEAAISFAKQLRPQDRVLIVSFNNEVLLLTEVTNDLNVISATIEENANLGSATRVYDAVHLVIKERLNKIKGRKAIVLFSDGVDTASYQATYESTMREVEELDALIYPIQYDTTDYLRAMQGGGDVTVVTTNNGPFGSSTTKTTYKSPGVTGPNGQPLPGATQEDYDRAGRYLNELADKTAGRLYKANDTTQLASAFSQIAEELRRQYSLGYYPTNGVTATSADRRQIKVRVNRPNVAVKARDSYLRSTHQ